MRKLFRKIAGILVTWYYSRMYRQAVKMADEQHERDGAAWYVVDHLYRGKVMSVIDRKAFRRMKMDAQRWTNPNYERYFSNDYNISLVKEGCWYRTADRSGNNAMSARDIEIRRLALVRIGLVRARLLDINETASSHDEAETQNKTD